MSSELLTILLNASDSIFLFAIFIVLLIKRDNSQTEIEEFNVTFNSLSTVLTSYKNNVLQPKIDALSKDHNLDPTSESNSIKAFKKAKEHLIKEAGNEIFSKFINKRTIRTLDRFYTREGLILFIITYFRG